MIARRRRLIHTTSAALSLGLVILSACSDFMGPGSYTTEGPRVDLWIGQYASALEAVVLDDRPTSVQAHLDLYQSPACQLYAKFSREEPDDWTIFHSASCDYYVERGVVTLILRLRVHYPGGNELIDASATFEPVDHAWSAVLWTNIGIRLEAVVDSRS